MELQESLNIALEQTDLIGRRFYEVFFKLCPEATVHFDGIDMKRQVHVVTMVLIIVVQLHTHRFEATQAYLRYLGTRHNDRRIPRELYSAWRNAMLETLAAAHGDRWADDVAGQWAAAFDGAIELMSEGYETRVTV